jgi:hypothetical protein
MEFVSALRVFRFLATHSPETCHPRTSAAVRMENRSYLAKRPGQNVGLGKPAQLREARFPSIALALYVASGSLQTVWRRKSAYKFMNGPRQPLRERIR